jgi:hypothetical protein
MAAFSQPAPVATPFIATRPGVAQQRPLAILGPRPAIFSQLPPRHIASAMGKNLINVDEIEAASPFLRIKPEYASWRDDVLFPYADAINQAPDHEARLRRSFDLVNRANADRAKVAQHGEAYFASAQALLTKAIASTTNKAAQQPAIRYTRLFQIALENGWDGRTTANANAQPGTTVVPFTRGVLTTTSALSFLPVMFDAPDLYPAPWLVLGLLLRGELSVLTGAGGSAKTALAIHIAVAIAAGRHYVGPFKVNTRPDGLRVAIMSAEEDPNRIGLLVAAACNLLCLTPAERASVGQNLMVHDAGSSGWRLGEPRDARGSLPAEADDQQYAALCAALAAHKPDVLILDTLAALFALPSEIDNNVLTVLMRRLTKAARHVGCAVMLLHHTPKMSREAAAAQRGEATLVRGGGAIVNSARIVLSVTSLPAAEAAQFAIQGLHPDAVRRLEHVKINDMSPMAPVYLRVISEQVRVRDGSDYAVRAVEFIPPPPAASAGGGIPDAMRNVAMKAIDAGVPDEHGHRVPLSPGGGQKNRRDATKVIADALAHANGSLSDMQAKSSASAVLKDLRERIGCVVEQEVQIPRYKAGGQLDGNRKVRGLACRWDLAPWMHSVAAAVAPVADVPVPAHAQPDEMPAATGDTGDQTESVADA